MSRGIICQSRSPPSGNGTMRTFRSFNPFSVFYVLFVSQKSVGILALGNSAKRQRSSSPVTGVCSINSMISIFILTLSLSILRVGI